MSNHQVCCGFLDKALLTLSPFHILVVGSAMWAQKKNVGKLTVESLEMSWDEEVRSTEAINNESVHCVQPNAGTIFKSLLSL